MKKLILFLVFAVAAFAQRGGQHSAPAAPHSFGAPTHFSQPAPQAQQHFSGVQRFGQPGGEWHRLPVRPPVVIVRPGFGFYGGFGWNNYYGMGFWPYYYPYTVYGPSYVIAPNQAVPCKKETLKDSDGKKHQVLVCVQPDGSYKVVADANTMVAVPQNEVKK